MPVLKYYDGSDWEPVVSALQGPTGPTGVAVGLPTGGATGTVLTKASSTDYDTIWSLPGKILQVVQSTTSTATTVASTTFTDTGLTATITPTLNTSKILVMAVQQVQSSRTANSAATGLRLLRDATTIFDFDNNAGFNSSLMETNQNFSHFIQARVPVIYLDTPSTNSATTYKLQGRVNTTANSGTSIFQQNSSISSIILMEVGL